MQKIDSYKFTGSEYEPFFKYWKLFHPDYSNGYRFQNISDYTENTEKNLERFSFSINGNHTQKIYDLVGETDNGVFLVILSLFGMLLNKYSDEKRVIIDTPLYKLKKGEKQYTRTVPLLLNVDPGSSLKKYFSHCQQVIKDCYKYQNFPLDLLHKAFDVKEIYKSNILIRYKGLHLDIERRSGYDLIIDIERKKKRLSFEFRYSGLAFYTGFIEALKGHIEQVLSQLYDVNIPVKDIKLLSEQEEDSVVRKFNNTKRDYPENKTLQELFEESAQATPDAIAVIYNEKKLTYKELNVAANRLAHHLRNKFGLKPNDLAGLIVDRSERMIIAILALLKAGAAYVPIDGEYPSARKEYIIKDADIRLLLTDSAYMFDQEYYSGDMFILDLELPEIENCDHNPSTVNKSSDLAYTIYTSGSTGQPKGVMVEHRNVVNMTLDQIRQFEICPTDIALQFASLSFDASVSEIFMALSCGAGLIIVDKDLVNETASFVQFMKKKKVSIVTLPPSYLSLIPNKELMFLRVLITAGEPAKPGDAREISRFCNYFNAYGPTECAVCVSIYKVDPEKDYAGSIPIGKPIANMEVYILDKNFQPTPIGVEGEIYVSGAGVSRGYINQDKLTKETFIPNPFRSGEKMYKTGDRGRWLRDGSVEFVGRKDYQVKFNGYRIELGEIEDKLNQLPEIKDSIMIIVESDSQRFLTAYYVSDKPLELERFSDHLKLSLPSYMVPSHFVHMDQFPLNTSGKVDRAALSKSGMQREGVKAAYVSPEIYPEHELVKIWEQTLNKNDIGVCDNFFYLGGDSIKAIRMVSLINERLNIELEVKDIFNVQDIRSLAGYINKELDSERRKSNRIKATEEIDGIKNKITSSPELQKILPRDWEDLYPMSHIQVGMLYHTLLDPGSGIYHDQMFHQFEDNQFSFDHFKQALGHLVFKHQILRTSFDLSAYGRPMQIVHRFQPENLDVELFDLANFKKKEQKNQLKKYLAEDLKQPLFMNKTGLWRMRVFRLATHEYGMLFVCHHAIIDGWSDASFFTELSNIYYRLKEGLDYDADPLRATYKDFIIEQFSVENAQHIKDFWKKELAGYARTILPFHKSAYQGASRKHGTFSFILQQELNQALTRFAEEHSIAIKHICLAAFIYLLKGTTNSDEITVGLVSNARPDMPDGDKILGCFLNTIPFCQDIPVGINGKDFAWAVHEKSQRIKAYDKLALQEILRLIGEKTSDQNPMFDIMFNYVDFHITDNQHKNTQIKEPIVTSSGSNNTQFGFSIKRLANTHRVSIVFLENLYSESELKKIGEYYNNIIDRIVNNSAASLSVSDMLSDEEKSMQLDKFNATAIDYPHEKTLHALFEERVQISGRSTALNYHGKKYSYKEINERANQLAHYLRETLNVESDDLIALSHKRSEWSIISVLGILKSGAAYLPLDLSYPNERISYILKETKPKALILDNSDPLESVDTMAIPKISLQNNLQKIDNCSKEDPSNINTPKDLAYVIYTSGSTGLPKGVMIEHKSIVNTVLDHIDRFSIAEDDNVMQFFNLSFDASVFEIFTTLCGGAALVISDKKTLEDVDSYVDYIRRQNVNVAALPPAYLDLIPAEKLNFLRLIITGGESPNLKTALSCSAYARYFSAYGPSECAVCATTYEVKPHDQHKEVPIGSAIANTHVYVMTDALDLAPIGVEGEICISGMGLGRGYVNDLQLTNDKFVKNPFTGAALYKTGDIGKWTSSGDLVFIRRKDDQIKIRGARVELNEINQALRRNGKIKEALCLVTENSRGEKQITAYFTAEDELNVSDLKKRLNEYLPRYMMPAAFILLSAFPLTLHGKIDRNALPDPVDQGAVKSSKYEAPDTDLEKKLVEIWERLLDKKGIGVRDDFFMMGGHSLKAMQAVTAIYKEIRVSIELRDLFINPTVKELAKLITKSTEDYQPILPAPALEHYPVSHAQKRLWTLNQFEESKTAYNIPGAYIFKGELDRDAFQRAFQTVTDRHETLRTIFVTVNGEPRQKILRKEEVDFDLEYHNFIDDKLNKESTIKRFVKEQSATAFDLENGPLLKAKLLHLDREFYIFLITIHHIISDGRSMSIMVSEVISTYNALKHGKTPDLRPLKIQYKDYAIWQNDRLSGERLIEYKSYWLNRFKGEIPLINLPADRPRPSVKTYNGDSASITLDREIVDRARKFANARGATLFMTLMATVKTLLYRYTGQSDIIIGSPIVSREHPDLEDQIGFYVNTLAIRSTFNGEESFNALLNSIKENTLSAFEYQSYPFDKLVEDLNLERLADRSPLFDVVIAFQNSAADHDETQYMDGIASQKLSAGTTVSKVDLTFNFVESGDDILVHLIYNNDIFKKDRINRLLTHLKRMLTSCLENSDNALNTHNYLTDEELDNVIVKFNDTAQDVPSPHTMHELFEKRVSMNPNDYAVSYAGRKWTYHEINEKANQLASYIRETYHIQPDDVVGLMVNRSERMIVAILGILKAGAAFLPIDPDYPVSRIEFMLRDANAKALLTDSDLMFSIVDYYEGELLALDIQLPTLTGTADNLTTIANPSDLAYVIYTSGSTGTPKGVMIEHLSSVNMSLDQIKKFGIRQSDNILQFASLSFDASVSEIFMALYKGAALTLIGKEAINDSKRFIKFIKDNRTTVVTLPPAYLNILPLEGLTSCRVIITAGEEPDVKNAVSLSKTAKYFNAYGPTECAVCVSVFQTSAEHNLNKKIPIGRPIANTCVYILDKDLNPVGMGIEGELCVAGLGLARGYLNRRDLTDEKFVQFPFNNGERIYKTGDWAKWRPDGTIELIGRRDAQVKIRGHRIELDEIKNNLALDENVADSVTMALENGNGKELISYVKRKKWIELWPSVAEYFVYDDVLYGTMSGDELRNEKFRRAFRRKLKDKTVLEVGPGGDAILSRICIEEGAKKVYAVEILEEAFLKAKKTIEDLNLQDKITLIHGDATKIELPEKVDYCVSEIVGSIGGSEGSAKIINGIRNKLKDPSSMIPFRSLTQIAAITLPEDEFKSSFEELGAYYVDKVFEQVGRKFDLRVCLHAFPKKNIISTAGVFEDIDYRRKNHLEGAHPINLKITSDAVIHGFALWLNLYCDEDEIINSLEDKHIWLPVYLPVFSKGRPARKGDRIEAVITKTLSANKLNPDFTIEGIFHSRRQGRIAFRHVSKNSSETYKSCAFYQKIFENDEIKVTSKLDADDLKSALRDKLPEYMIPASIIKIEEFPLTLNGKIDYKKLASGNRELQNQNYIPPENEIQDVMAAVWQKTLGRPTIGIEDNFFELGGDSIKAIQISSRLHSNGYKVEIKDIFQRPTIRELSAIVKSVDRVADQDLVVGNAPFTPIQREFFEWGLNKPHHFNQSIMLFDLDGFDEKMIKTAFSKVQEHHDALRAIFPQNNEGVCQEIQSLELPLAFEVQDLRNRKNELQELNRKANKLQRSLNLQEGPLMKVGLFHLSDGDRLLIVAHHLIVDGVSWRILLDDISTLFEQYKKKRPLELPLKTDSYKLWGERLYTYANSKIFQKEIIYWRKVCNSKVPELKRDYPVEKALLKDIGSHVFVLTPEETFTLLSKSNARFNTEINHILIAALGLAVKRVFDIERLGLSMEGHGREPILDEIDISRTVGWFTSFYPVVIDFSWSDQLGRQIKEVKEYLRQVPNNGIGYGILKLLTSAELKKGISLDFQPQISFNYLGQFDSDTSNNYIQMAEESMGSTLSPDNQKLFDFDISGVVSGGRLLMTIRYSRTQYKPATVKTLAQKYQDSLKEVIRFCSEDAQTERTPSDFTHKGLTIAQVGRLTRNYEIDDICPLAPMQEGIFFHHIYDRKSTAYFNQVSYRLHGALKPDIVQRSFNEMLARHDILRTAYIYESLDRPVQLVLKNREIDFHYEDISGRDKKKQDQYIRSYKQADKERLFDLSKDKLMRVAIFQLDELEYELLWSYHHILMDGWCTGIFTTEFLELYNSLEQNRSHTLSPGVQYQKYLEWLHDQDDSLSRNFWKKYLDGYSGAGNIRNAISIKNHGHNKTLKQWVFALNKEKTKSLQDIALKYRVTVNTLFQAIWGVLLSKYLGSNDVAFGAVVAGRPTGVEGIESMIGLFLNTIPVRITYEPDDSFEELIRGIQEKAIESEPFQHYPLVEIQGNSSLNAPLFDHILTFENYPLADEIEGIVNNPGGNSNDPAFGISHVSAFEETNYHLNLVIVNGGQLRVKFDYNPYAFKEEAIMALGGHLSAIIDQTLDDQKTAIKDISLRTKEEIRRIYCGSTIEKASYPDCTLHELFEKSVMSYGDKIAVRHKGEAISYKELNERANQMARYLRKNYDIKPDDKVAILADRGVNMVIALLGVLKSGGAYVPIDIEFPQDRIKFILSDTQAKALLVGDTLNGDFLSDIKHLRISDDRIYGKNNTENLSLINSKSDLAYVIYTSGSTGEPKGVMIPHKGVVNRIDWMWKHFGFTIDDIILQKTPYVFDVSVWEFFMTLCYGAELALCDSEIIYDPVLIAGCIEEYKASTVHFVPSMLNKFIAEMDEDLMLKLKSLKRVIASGEALMPETVQAYYHKLNTPLHNLYGPTEASIDVTSYATDPEDHTTPIGKPITNIGVYVVDQQLHVQPVDLSGELLISGVGLARGYLNRKSLTQEKFIKNPYKEGEILYKTGDIGRLLSDGNIEYIGRSDAQIKLRGHRIELGEIENALISYPNLKKVAVADREDGNGDKFLAAFYESGEECQGDALRNHLKTKLPEYMIPSLYIRLDEFPYTVSGKIDRAALSKLEIKARAGKKIVPPATDLEAQLLEIWCEALPDAGPISVEANFFEIGGHSLKAMKIASDIAKKLNVRIEIKLIFEHSTIKDLAQAISRAPEFQEIPPAGKQEFYPAAHGQKGIFLKSQYGVSKKAFFVMQMVEFNKINKSTLEDTIASIITRHESLRTTFLIHENEVKQQIHDFDAATTHIEYIQLQEGARIRDYIDERMRRPFDLENGPLYAFTCFELPNGKFKLLILIDHIISDAWSSDIIKSEIIRLYKRLEKGEENLLPPLKLQYKDYACWQNKLIRGGMQKHKKYWHDLLSDPVPELSLGATTDDANYMETIKEEALQYCQGVGNKELELFYGAVSSLKPLEGVSYRTYIDSQTLGKLHQFRQATGVSLFSVIAAGVHILLYKYTGQNDTVVGTPVTVREHADLQELLGWFLNTILLRNKLDRSLTLMQTVKRVQKNNNKSLPHRSYPFEQLLYDINMPLTRVSRVFIHLLNFETTQKRLIHHFRPSHSGYGTPTFDLNFTFREFNNGIELVCDYNKALYAAGMIEKITEDFHYLINNIIQNPDEKLENLLTLESNLSNV